jgi:hypothetical protein
MYNKKNRLWFSLNFFWLAKFYWKIFVLEFSYLSSFCFRFIFSLNICLKIQLCTVNYFAISGDLTGEKYSFLQTINSDKLIIEVFFPAKSH